MDKSKIYIVIAAYNEESSIETVVKRLRKAGYTQIVIVDDGSKDKTYEIIKKLKVHALKHVINRGQGAALKTGIDYALLKNAELIITFDADGQHDEKEIKDMVQPILKNQADITIGSRFIGKAINMPKSRKLALKLGVLVLKIMYGVELTDSQNGFRALSRKAAKKIEIKSDRMEHAGEIIGEIKKKNLRFKEVPVTIRYTDYSQAHSSQSGAIALGLRMVFRKLIK
jgi:polyprenyl-phospho-N-acetylgalactosaminyl synthase